MDNKITEISNAADNAISMTLRDWFAGMAMQGLCGSDVWPNDANIPYIAKLSYEMADEMIKAREAK